MQNTQNLLQEKAQQASREPGVYRMLDKHGTVLYVGKAKNLHNRLLSYFQPNADHDTKTQVLVKKIFDFDTILTDSEAEALILECILIKKHKPRYNILLKDDKSYPYLAIDRTHSFPKIVYTRRPQKKKNIEVYGPYVSAGSLRQVLRIVNHTFKLRDCMDSEFANRSRPCINHPIGLCSAPCVGLISQEDYTNDVNKAIQTINGSSKDIIAKLTKEMEDYSQSQEYEKAAATRDQINAIQEVSQMRKQKISTRQLRQAEHRDTIGFYQQDDVACIVVLFIRNEDLIDSKQFFFNNIKDTNKETILENFLAQFYLYDESILDKLHIEQAADLLPGIELKIPPEEVLLPFAVKEVTLLQESLLRYKIKTKFTVPLRGKNHDLILMAEKNAKHALEEKTLERSNIYRTLSELKIRLRLNNYPRHVECFDISNLGNTGIVASRVSFIEGKPEKSLYRHYKIRSVESQNDFAAMKEVITRSLISARQTNANADIPDLIIIDGGKGQLSMASEAFKELNITGVDLVALAKRNPENPERIFKPGQMNPIALQPDSPLCHFLERIRDEAHRFAVTFQRKQRTIT